MSFVLRIQGLTVERAESMDGTCKLQAVDVLERDGAGLPASAWSRAR